MSPTPVNEGSTANTPSHARSTPTHGRSPVVVFVPGLGLDSRSWQLVGQELREPSSVVLLPSMGQRAPRGTGLSVERQAERLVQGLPQRATIILVGHSASCPVVVQAATRTPDVVGLVLVGPVTDPAARTWPRMLTQWARTASHERPGEALTLVPQYRHTGILSMLRGMDAIRCFRTDLALRGLGVPVEIVRGDKDRIASLEWSSVLRQESNGRLTTIHGAAHMVPNTHPIAVAAAVDRLRHAAAKRSYRTKKPAVTAYPPLGQPDHRPVLRNSDLTGPRPSPTSGVVGGLRSGHSGERAPRAWTAPWRLGGLGRRRGAVSGHGRTTSPRSRRGRSPASPTLPRRTRRARMRDARSVRRNVQQRVRLAMDRYPHGYRSCVSRSVPEPIATIDELTASTGDVATVVDAREPGEYVDAHVPGALLRPMGQLPARAASSTGAVPSTSSAPVGPAAAP